MTDKTYRLSPEEIAFYRTNGYTLYKKPVFSSEKFSRLKTIFEEHLANKGDKSSDSLDMPHTHDPRLLEFLLSDEILDLVEPITGPNIVLWASGFVSKDPYSGAATPWHEDSAYWNGRVDAFENIVTVWLAIDPATKDNGCMRVVAGTHTNGFSEYKKVEGSKGIFHSEIAADIDEDSAVYFELQPNECSLHDSRIIHGARANTSPLRRTGYTMRYFPASIRVIPERNKGHKLWLARGTDSAGNTYQNA
jgi:ectoine hydroxylase-related dioxygenase (phytanoyl-CoA dioxygenase family)